MVKSKIQVSAGILMHQQAVLIAKRPLHVPYGGLWEFPGGKIEAGEDGYTALCRELKEEIGIEVLEATPFLSVNHEYENMFVALQAWQVLRYQGNPSSVEGQALRWVPLEKLQEFDFPNANHAIIEKLLKIYLLEYFK